VAASRLVSALAIIALVRSTATRASVTIFSAAWQSEMAAANSARVSFSESAAGAGLFVAMASFIVCLL
jgi:hypothetical protein